MIDLHDIIVCFAIASMASGALLLNRFIYPFLFPYLPNWKSAYIASVVVFVGLFFSLLLSRREMIALRTMSAIGAILP